MMWILIQEWRMQPMRCDRCDEEISETEGWYKGAFGYDCICNDCMDQMAWSHSNG